jgi:Secretion system C-terminal sorting domain
MLFACHSAGILKQDSCGMTKNIISFNSFITSMKIQFLYISFALLSSAFLFTSNAGGVAAVQNKGYTGAPGDEMLNPNTPKLCGSCHTGGTYNPTATIQLLDANNTPVTKYNAGVTYTVRFTITAGAGTPAGYGFQMIDIRNADSTNFKGFVQGAQPAGTQIGILTNGRMYAEQTARSATNVFNLKWKAATAGKGAITFYAVGNAVNSNSGTGGDSPTASIKATFAEQPTGLNELENAVTEFNLFPNPTLENLNVKMELQADKICEVLLTNAAGKVVLATQWQLKSGANAQNIDMSAYAAGQYQLTLRSKDGVFSKSVYKF